MVTLLFLQTDEDRGWIDKFFHLNWVYSKRDASSGFLGYYSVIILFGSFRADVNVCERESRFNQHLMFTVSRGKPGLWIMFFHVYFEQFTKQLSVNWYNECIRS